jgi:CRP-like cAMP-binding protein
VDTHLTLYLIARGVVRVSREERGKEKNLGTLMAGDFFGEMALMHHQTRNATIRCVTPCLLYELEREAVTMLMEQHPDIAEKIERIDQARQKEATVGQHSG